MYVPQHFRESRVEVIQDLVRANPFCSLVTAGTDGLFVTHLPMILDPTRGAHGTLRGHIARANPHKELEGREAVAIFNGGDAYVSPSYYPSKRQHGKVVPTWNYSVVHASGTVRFVDDPASVARTVEELTVLMESSREHPWKVSDAPADFLAAALKSIVGVELQIRSWQAKSKLSQNRGTADIQGVIDGLGSSPQAGDQHVSEIMRHISR